MRIWLVSLAVFSALVGAAVQAQAQASAGPWAQVAAGSYHTCAINTSKSLYCWGANSAGQVGDGGTSSPRLVINRVGESGVWSSVTAGQNHTCGITTGRSLYCWGSNDQGQAGDGTTKTPVLILNRVGAGGVWQSASAGSYHTCGITTAKNLYCWGLNLSGQVGDGGTSSPRLSLYRVGGAGVWASVDAGDKHTCGITTAKNLYCWGYNSSGQVGDGTTNTPRLSLYRVGGAGVWAMVAVSPGGGHTCGITTGKNLYCWGLNSYGQVGDGTTNNPRLSLYRVGAAGVWGSVAAGDLHTCGITSAKNLYCWGNNNSGQVGDGTTNTPRLSLYRVGGTGVWASAAAGDADTCGITSAQNLYCWGYNSQGEVGDGTTSSPRLTLYRVP